MVVCYTLGSVVLFVVGVLVGCFCTYMADLIKDMFPYRGPYNMSLRWGKDAGGRL